MAIARYTKHLLIIAVVIYAVSIGIIATLGIPFGIDFTGGALTEVSYDTRPDKSTLESNLNALNLGDYSLRATTEENGRAGYILRTRDLSDDERQQVQDAISPPDTGVTVDRFTSIGPVIGEELRTKALWALSAVLLIIVLYVAFVFRKVSKPVGSWIYGGITILVLFHDVLVPTAVMSLLGYFIGAEADVLFVMALLAVLGYSVNDTIVVFDRVRENLLRSQEKRQHEPFDQLVDHSVTQTLARSINTSLTTLLALVALYIFGGDVTKTFSLMLIAGIIAGTYSSIAIANPLLILLAKRRSKDAKGVWW